MARHFKEGTPVNAPGNASSQTDDTARTKTTPLGMDDTMRVNAAPTRVDNTVRTRVNPPRVDNTVRANVNPPRVDAVPSPAQYRYYDEQVPRRERPSRAGAGVARVVLTLVIWVCRLSAIGLSAVVVLDCFSNMRVRVALFNLTAAIASAMPSQLAGMYVIDTPFGGAFRGDFAICAVVLFVADWILCRVRGSLRR